MAWGVIQAEGMELEENEGGVEGARKGVGCTLPLPQAFL